MKKRFNTYVIIWVILLALFNVIAFVSIGWKGEEKYTPSFWIGYGFITAAFAGQLICTKMAFKAESVKKLFYKIPLIKTSYTGLIASFIVGGLCMLLSPLPYWVGAIVCAVVLGLNAIAVMGAKAAVEEVERIDTKIKSKTFFIKSLTTDADTLVASAKSDDVKASCVKVYEAIRYSDPLSNEALASVESQITLKFSEFSDAVKADDNHSATALAKELIVLVGDRNKKCKLLK